MDALAEIVEATESKAPEASAMTTPVTPEATNPEQTTTEMPPAGKLPGASHKEGDLTRRPGETRGRKTNQQRQAEDEAARQATIQQQIEARAQELADYKITGRQLSDGFIFANVTFFGPEFNYFPVVRDAQGAVVKDERAEFYKIGGDMAEQYGWRKLPPYVQIILILTAYYGIRAAMPPVRQKFGGYFKGAWLWCAGKINKLFTKKPAPTPAAAPPPGGESEKKS